MCNPLWDGVFAPCILVIEVENDCGADVQICVGGECESAGSGRRFDLGPQTDFSARVEVRSPGDECTVFVTSRVEGPDPRGPDVCTMRVTHAAPFAFETINVSTR